MTEKLVKKMDDMKQGDDPKQAIMDFDLLEMGVDGYMEVVPPQGKNRQWLMSTLPVGLPPVMPNDRKKLEEFLTKPESLPIHDLNRAQRFWPREAVPSRLYHIEETAPQTNISVDRHPTSGKLIGYKEEAVLNMSDTAKNSLSLKRAPGPPDQGVKGSSTNFPFWPGGLTEPDIELLTTVQDDELLDFKDLLSTPPGFASGVEFARTTKPVEIPSAPVEVPTELNIADILALDDLEFSGESDEEDEINDDKKMSGDNVADAEIDELVKGDTPTTVERKKQEPKEEWVIPVDISTPVDDFHKRIPDMAYKWPFELDVFQKQAILCLENHDSVFVAAHTSAGKTVVAEYAIALSMKHMTRTIYTSPIKALSNQKFRDFKVTFGDVGLITGDVQIHPEAACLIMTTEILRSMLYNGSDVIRDLEWVIFDEVHYINDSERGVVWEEVLIMLPQHVNIIMLSATVPNTMEFADWVGRIKKKRMYVISTTKRPVPLEHYLYTGNSTKTSNELFLILDSTRQFKQTGYYKALDAKKERASKSSQSYGAKGTRGGNPMQDKNIWLSVIDMLKKKDKMPTVAFTFSKKRIEENANHLRSVDLTTASEKSEVHIFFHRCVSKLKPEDRDLPQVTRMCDLLKRGLGIHHSGILPILKEVVEMLFQRGLVKILFATETFAMGVNMPARTVVFDSIRKHDGTNFRDLLPGEYIQMAGRAGRRGLDTTGTVILLCKGDVPEMADLHNMMLGKPTKLESQFRLTYSMILNLLRVEQLRVEDMMKRSFSEFHAQKDITKNQELLEETRQKLYKKEDVQCFICDEDLKQYFTACRDYKQLRQHIQKIVLNHPNAIKALAPGRVVISSLPIHDRILGLVLQTHSGKKERTFSILILCNKSDSDVKLSDKEIDLDSETVRPILDNKLFMPEGATGHKMVEVKSGNISVITTKTLKINAERIINDFKKREQPRFKSDPPGQAVTIATQELLRLTEGNPDGLPGLDPVNDLKLRDMDLVEKFLALKQMEGTFGGYSCTNCSLFNQHFAQVCENMILEEKMREIKFLLSDESLSLLPEYEQRVQVLRSLKYIDENNTVQLKGRVACEISNHELLITELVFENVLTSLHPGDIAALLSCVVFEQKNCSAANMSASIEEGVEKIKKIAENNGIIQKQCGLTEPVEDYVKRLNFELTEVVFEWSRGMKFSDITDLTDVQEGIIVRSIQRLDEVLRDVRNAARIIGDPVLYQKMEEASRLIKRDIVFAASLYTQ